MVRRGRAFGHPGVRGAFLPTPPRNAALRTSLSVRFCWVAVVAAGGVEQAGWSRHGPPGLTPQNVVLTPGQGGTVNLDVKGGQGVPPGNYTVFLRGQTQPINPKGQPPKGTPQTTLNGSICG